jgi:hypothetical protein
MNPLINMVAGQLGGAAMQQLSQHLGAEEKTTQSAVGMALPMILSAIGNRAGTPDGADVIQQASQEQDDSILDDVLGFVSNAAGGGNIGGALLGQVLGGGNQNSIASAISQNTGLNSGAAGQLVGILMPLIMAGISKISQSQGGGNAAGIAQMLGGLAGASGGSNDLLGMASKVLDADGDGNVVEDVGNLFNKIF